MSTAPTPARRLARADREQQMLATARRMFAERGYAAVTMDDVAAEVGVTKPLLYRYFGNKDELYLACMAPAGEALVATVVEAVAGARTAAETLRAGITAFFDFVDADRQAWRVLFGESTAASARVGERVREVRERLAGLITAEQLERVPPARRDAVRARVEALSAALLGAAETLAHWWLRTGAISAREAAELLITTVEPGLQERP